MKTDLMNKVLKALDHNRYTVVSIVVFVVLMVMAVSFVGCQSTTASLIPDQGNLKVNRTEFNRQVTTLEKDLAVRRVKLDGELAAFNEEVKAFNLNITAANDDLNRQDEIRSQILDTVGLVVSQAAESSLNPASLIPIGIGLFGASLGLGTSADNRRKDKVITELKQTSGTGQIVT